MQMGQATKTAGVVRVVADVLWESGGGVRKPVAEFYHDAQGRDVLCGIDRTGLEAAGLAWRKDMATERPS